NRRARSSDYSAASGRGRLIPSAGGATPWSANDAPCTGAVESGFRIDASPRSGYQKLAAPTTGRRAAACRRCAARAPSPGQRGAGGHLVRQREIASGSVFHPGGLDFDGAALWTAVSEYRPHSRAQVLRIEPASLAARAQFTVADHLGTLVHVRGPDTFVVSSW